MISGIKQVTVTASATSVVLSKIDPRNSSYTKGPLTKKGIDGKLHRFKDAALLVITAFDNENFAQLETWMRAKTSITHIEVMAVDEHVYWKVATALIVKKNYGQTTTLIYKK